MQRRLNLGLQWSRAPKSPVTVVAHAPSLLEAALLQWSRAPKSPVTETNCHFGCFASKASMEPGSEEPGDAGSWGMFDASHLPASMEPGSEEPGDQPVGTALEERPGASMEPGSEEPGDQVVTSQSHHPTMCFNGAGLRRAR